MMRMMAQVMANAADYYCAADDGLANRLIDGEAQVMVRIPKGSSWGDVRSFLREQRNAPANRECNDNRFSIEVEIKTGTSPQDAALCLDWIADSPPPGWE